MSKSSKRSANAAFIVVAAILLASAIGLNAATQFMQLYFKKLPVLPARPLTQLAPQLGPWMQVSIDEPLSAEFQDALATDKYVFRDYVDTRAVTPQELAVFKDKTPGERQELIKRLQLQKPAAVVNLGVSYYTGLADTVAHIPERCYVASGFVPTNYDVAPWDALRERPGDKKVRSIVFEDELADRRSVKTNVSYFFNCNALYMNDSIAVRSEMANLRHAYGYYMKIEMKTIQLSPQDSARVMNDFLENLLPETEKCLPDWKKLNAR